MQLWDTAGKQLTASGGGAPTGSAIISAELTYGGAGSCQQATIRPINTSTRGRDTEWVLSLSGVGSVFRGIPDTIGDADGQLAQVGLMPSHRPRLDAPGTSLGGVQAGEFETLASALQRELGDQPNADIGIRPDGSEVAGVPYGGGVYTLDSRAYDLRYLGAAYPDAVTDAVFDPGEGWKKYLYHRATPPYALRKTASATADPAIIGKTDTATVLTRQTAPIQPIVDNGVTHSFNNVLEADGVERNYAEGDSTKTNILSDAGIWTFSTPADTDVRRTKKIRIRCPFFVSQIAPWPPPAVVQFAPVETVTSTTPSDSVAIIVVGDGAGSTSNANPATVAPGATLDQVAGAVNANAVALNNLQTATNRTAAVVTQATGDIGALSQRVNKIISNTTNSAGEWVNLADEVKKVADKLNKLGDDTKKLSENLITPRNTPRRGELKLGISLSLLRAGVETKLKTTMQMLKEQDIGLELAMQFEIDKDLGNGAEFKLRYELVEQDTGRSITMIFRPIEVTVDYDTPNVEGVKMPAGWDKPFRTEPRFEFRLPGWHIPPLLVAGLPGGYSQMAAGSTVTWNRNECSTLITTAAWGYG